MSSDFDPRRIRWARVEVPEGQGRSPVVLRSTAPPTLMDGPPETLLDEVTAGLAGQFSEVLAIDVVVDPPDVRRGAVRLVHAAVGRDGEGVAVETLLRRDGDVTCWVAPTARYAAELATARRVMGGRPPLPAKTDADEPPIGVPVSEMRLVTARRDVREPACWALARRGRLANVRPPDGTPPRPLPASVLPVWLASVIGAGPRPAPSGHRMVIASRAALEDLLDLTAPDEAEVRAVLEAPDLPASDVAALAELAAGTELRWSLEWTSGFDGAQEPADEDWSTARGTRRGRTEILDAGPAGLWRILTDLPDALAEDTGADAVGLTHTTMADVWCELTLPLAD